MNSTYTRGYSYDAANRIKSVGGNNPREYDGDGRRVRNDEANAGNIELYYLWSSVLGQVVADLTSGYSTTYGIPFRAYVYSPSGALLGQQSYNTAFTWTHTDHLGSGHKLTDSSGAVVAHDEYDPHGQWVLSVGSASGYYTSHKFTGYERDYAAGSHYAQARQYHHNNARFLQADPLGLGASDLTNPQSLNLYSYVQNDPVNLVDPTGLNLEAPIVIETREPYALDSSLWRFFFNSWFNSLGGGGGSSDASGGAGSAVKSEKKLPCPPTGDELARNPIVKSALERALSDSYPGETGNLDSALGGAVEQSGLIYWNPENGGLFALRLPRLTTDLPKESNNLNNPPQFSGFLIVGTFHTHPFSGPSPTGVWAPGVPSPGDKNAAIARNVPGLIQVASGKTLVHGPHRAGDDPVASALIQKLSPALQPIVQGYPADRLNTRNCQ